MDELVFSALCDTPAAHEDLLVLPFAERQKARQRALLESGRAVGLKLPRGTVLRGGDLIRSDCGLVVKVQAANEPVSTVRAVDPVALARVAYHLGNRHVWVQVGDGWLRYLADHVLDDMVRGLGAEVSAESAPFEPEAGAYSAGGGHHHHHGHDHAH